MIAYATANPQCFEERIDSKGRPWLFAIADNEGIRHCANCGEALHSNRQKTYCNSMVELVCFHPDCKKSFKIKCNRARYVRQYCSSQCGDTSPFRTEQQKATTLKKYGVESVFQLPENKAKAAAASTTIEAQEKKKATNRKRYGADWPAQNPKINEEYLARQRAKNGGRLAFNTEKQKETMIKRYGVDHPMKSEELRLKAQETQRKNNGGVLAFNTAKQRETMIERYGSAGPLGDAAVREKIRETLQERYGVDHPSKVPDFLEKAHRTQIERYGALFSQGASGSRLSSVNIEFKARLEELISTPISQEFALKGSIFDLHIEGTNILIDINPTVTHNATRPFKCLRAGCELSCDKHLKLPRDYHYKRALLAQVEGYRLIQVYDWDDERIVNFIAGKLLPAVKVSARKLQLKSISIAEANEFLNEHHIQGGVRGQTHRYGLFVDNELIAVATFGKARFKAKASHEWLRYAVKAGYLIHGGPQKLFSHFTKEAAPQSVISYVNFDHTTGPTFLNSTGFSFERNTGPTEVWHKKREKRMIANSSLLAQGADRLLGTSYGSRESSGLNNEQIMVKENWVKLFTSGNQVFRWQSVADV